MADEKKRGGRKPSPTGRKSINMSIRVSPEEKELIKRKAKEAHLPASRFIVDTLLERR